MYVNIDLTYDLWIRLGVGSISAALRLLPSEGYASALHVDCLWGLPSGVCGRRLSPEKGE